MSKQLGAIYVRVSSDPQDKRLGKESQLDACLKYCADNGIDVTEDRIFTDTITGSALERPGMNDLIASVAVGKCDILIMNDYTRFARDYIVAGQLRRRLVDAGLKVIAYAETKEIEDPSNEATFLIRLLKDGMSEEEVRKFVARTTRGRKKSVTLLDGVQVGNRPPYGFKTKRVLDEKAGKEKTILVLNPDEVKAVKKIFKLYTGSKAISQREVVRKMRESNHPTRTGADWSVSSVRKILINELYVTGTWAYGKSKRVEYITPDGKVKKKQVPVDESEWLKVEGLPQIIDQETWDKAQERRGENKINHPSSGIRKHFYLLKDRAICECGSKLWGTYSGGGKYKGKKRPRTLYYRCGHEVSPRHECGADIGYIRAEKLEQEVINFLTELLADPDRLADEVEKLVHEFATSDDANLERLRRREGTLLNVQRKMERLISKFGMGGLAEEVLERQVAELETQASELDDEIRILRDKAELAMVSQETINRLQEYWTDESRWADELKQVIDNPQLLGWEELWVGLIEDVDLRVRIHRDGKKKVADISSNVGLSRLVSLSAKQKNVKSTEIRIRRMVDL